MALPEGTALRREGDRFDLPGEHDAWLFTDQGKQRLPAGEACHALLEPDAARP